MNCKKYQQLYLLSLDGKLSARQKERLEKHMQKCSICQEQAEYTQRLNSRLQTLGKILPSEQILQKIRDKAYQGLQARQTQPFFIFPKTQVILSRVAYSMAVVAVFFVIWMFISTQKIPQHPIIVEKISRGFVDKDFETIERYFNNAYVADVRQKVKEAFSPVEQTKQLLALVSKSYDITFELKPESLDDALKNLESRVKK